MKIFGARLREVRKSKKLTQQELADKFGTNRVNVTKWETGRTEPSLENLVKLAYLFEVSLDWLFGRDE